MTGMTGPGSTIGILGAGQLGRMLAMVARQMGYRIAVFGGDRSSPAGQVCDVCWPGNFDNVDQLGEFAAASDVVTYEFENIPADAASVIAQQTPLLPGVSLLAAAQNRFAEKTALTAAGLKTAAFRMVSSAQALQTARADFGGSVILKSNTQGYDGKGQWSISEDTDIVRLWDSIGQSEAIVEQRVNFDFELSVVGGRYQDGTTRLYEPFLNHHANHILDVTVSGSPLLTTDISSRAQQMAQTVLEHFDVVGVLCLELFLTSDGQLLVNEIAPRPHNSGHLTIEAYNCSQFELQLRTICGLPDVPLVRKAPAAAMANLLGQHIPPEWRKESFPTLPETETQLHLYGKSEPRTNRKIGHLTATGHSADQLENCVRSWRDALRS